MRAVVLGAIATEDPGEMGPIERFFLRGMIDLFHDPSIIGQRLIGNMPIAMFFLLPMFALALAVFYIRKKRFHVEHLVFALHRWRCCCRTPNPACGSAWCASCFRTRTS